MTLRGRLLSYALIQVSALGVLFLASGFVVRARVVPMMVELLDRKTDRTTKSLASRLEVPMGGGDAALAQSTVDYVAADPDLIRLEVRDRAARLVASLGERPLPAVNMKPGAGLQQLDDAVVATEAIEIEGYHLGTISIAFSKARQRSIENWILAGGVAVGLACLVAVAVAFRFSRAFVAPIRRMIEFSHRIKLGGLSERVSSSPREGELSQLAADLNAMAEALETRDAVLAARGRELEESLARMQETLRQLKSTQQQLVHSEKFAVLGQTAATIAHEINNPAAFIQVNLEELARAAQLTGELCRLVDGGAAADSIRAWRADSGFDAALVEMVELVTECQGGMDRILTIVRDLRSFARSRESQGDVQLVEVADRALRIMGNDIRHRAHVQMVRREPVSLRADEGRLLQVMINLLSNALHAFGSRPASENRLEVSVWPESGRACFALRDNGCGIPADIRDQIFEPFFTTKPIGQGSGLGLGICRSIVEQHGGSISVDSEPGVGSEFRLVLPICR